MSSLWILALLLPVQAPAQGRDAVDLEALREGARGMGEAAGRALQPSPIITIKSSPDAAPPAAPEALCENDDFKPADGPCPALAEGEAPGRRAGLSRARIVRGRMTLEWGEREEGGRVLVYLLPFEIPFEVEQRLGVSVLYARDGCPYRVTLRHEKLHWADNRELYSGALASLRAALAAVEVPTERSPRSFPKDRRAEIDAWQDELGGSLARIVGRHRKAFKERALAAVRARDTPAEYERVYDSCRPAEWRGRGL